MIDLPGYRGTKLVDNELPEFLNANLVARLVGTRINGGARAAHMNTIADMVKSGRLPKPQKSAPGGSGRRFWKRDEVLAAIEGWRV